MVPASGNGLIVTSLLALIAPQLLLRVYRTVSVPEAAMLAESTPADVIDPMPVWLHVPPAIVAARDMLAPAHIDDGPVMLPAVVSGSCTVNTVTEVSALHVLVTI